MSLLALLYVFWCGLCWTLRGGWFGKLVRNTINKEPGTTATRTVCAGLIAAPLAYFIGVWALAVWLSIYVAMIFGYFDDSMGLEQPIRDHIFLALWGNAVTMIAISPFLYMNGWGTAAWAATGLLTVVAYASQKPLGRRFGWDWTERSEFLTGCTIGAGIFGAMNG